MGVPLTVALPGSAVLLLGLWWCYAPLLRFFLCRRKGQLEGSVHRGARRYCNTLLYPWCHVSAVPFEALFILVTAGGGIVAEFNKAAGGSLRAEDGVLAAGNSSLAAGDGLLAAGDGLLAVEEGSLAAAEGKWQRITVFFFFAFAAVVALLRYCRYPLPTHLDYLAAVLALSVEGIFLYEVAAHTPQALLSQVRMLQFYLAVGTTISLSLEMKHGSTVAPALCRAFFTLLQGSWWLSSGCILDSNEGHHWDPAMATLVFSWHAAATCLLMGVVGAGVALRVRFMSRDKLYRFLDAFHSRPSTAKAVQIINKHLGSNKTNDQEINSEDDEEVTFFDVPI